MFKRKKKKTGCETPTYSRFSIAPEPARSSELNPNYVPPPSVAKPKQKENKTMYGLKLYIPFEDLDTYIHGNTSDRYKDHTFIPVKVKVNELNCDIEICMVSAIPIESEGLRYKLDLNKLPKENN